MRTKGAAGHTIWQELRLLWEENLIRAGDIKTVDDERGTNLRIYCLTDQGWKRLDELASQIRRPVRSWVARHTRAALTATSPLFRPLTEAVKATPGALLVASLPASQIEIGGKGRDVALDRLKNTFG